MTDDERVRLEALRIAIQAFKSNVKEYDLVVEADKIYNWITKNSKDVKKEETK